MKKFFITLMLGFMMLPALAGSASALDIQKPDFLPGPSDTISGQDTQDYVFNTTIPRVLNILIGLLGLTAFIGIVIASITMLTSFGNEDKLNKAKTNLRYAMLGFVVVMLSYAIVSVIVAIALPSTGNVSSLIIPTAHADSFEDNINILLPSTEVLLEGHEGAPEVSLPSGDLVSELLPAIITNLFWLVGFLIFIAFMYGGTLLVIGRGNEDMTTKAKNIVIYATIALAMITGGYAIIYGIANLNLQQDDTTNIDDVFVETVQE